MSRCDSKHGNAGRRWAAGGFALAALWIAFAAFAELPEATTERGVVAAEEVAPMAAALAPDRVERGRYLVTIMACGDCHTPFVMGPEGPEPDASRLLSGHPQDLDMGPAPALSSGPWVWVGAGTNTAFYGPWGTTYATNLTPDENSGLGIWTEEIFIEAIRTGLHFGRSRPIMPPMPWQNFRHATDEDLASIFAYLRSVSPIENHVPDYAPPGGDVDEVAAWAETLRSAD